MATETDTTIEVDLLDVRKQNRRRRWREMLETFYCQSDYSMPGDFQRGYMQASYVSGIGIGRFATDPIAGNRTKSLLSRNPVDAYAVVLADKCPMIISQRGRVVRIEQESFAFISTIEPSSFTQPSTGAYQAMMIPGEVIRRITPRIDDYTAILFGYTPMHNMFYKMAREWSLTAHNSNPTSGKLVGHSIVDLLALAIDGADLKSTESVIRANTFKPRT